MKLEISSTEWIAKTIQYYDVIDSTNTKAKELAEGGSVHGTLVVADRQNAGRGRRGRDWSSPSGVSVYMTILLKPEFKPQYASMLTLVAALSVTTAIRELSDLSVQIKWPNDIVYHGKKICGILTELSAEPEHINYVVVGIGINVNNTEFTEEISDHATSLLLEGVNVERTELIIKICERFEYYYDIFCRSNDLSQLREEYEGYLANCGRFVRVLDLKEPFEGKAVGITDTGELIVDTEEGQTFVSSGEVSVRGIYGYV